MKTVYRLVTMFLVLVTVFSGILLNPQETNEPYLSMQQQNQIIQTILDEVFIHNNTLEKNYVGRADYVILSTRNLEHPVCCASNISLEILSREEIRDRYYYSNGTRRVQSSIFVEITKIEPYSSGRILVEFGFMYVSSPDSNLDGKYHYIMWGGSKFYFLRLGREMVPDEVDHMVI